MSRTDKKEWFIRYSENIVKALLVLIIAFLLFLSMTQTTVLKDWEEHNYYLAQKLWPHLLILAVLAAGVYLFGRFVPRRKYHKWETGVVFVLLSVAFCFTLYWVLNTQLKPTGDSSVIWTIAHQMDSKDYSAFRDLGYGERYFNQIGTIMLHYFLIHYLGVEQIFIIQLLNVPALLLLYYSLWRLSQELFGKRTGNLTVVLSVLFFPLALYVVFAYNNVFSWSLSMFAVLQEILFLKKGMRYHGILMAISLAAAVQFKMFSWIILFAMFIYAFYEGFRRSRRSVLFYLAGCVVLIFLLSFFFGKFIDSHLEGYQRKGLSPLGHVAMGMQDGPMAPGWYNGIHDITYLETQGEAEAMNAAFIRMIKDSILNFIAHPKYAFRFYFYKTASAWNNPSFQGFWFGEIGTFETDVPDWIQSVYNGALRSRLDVCLNYMLTVIHAGTLGYFLTSWKKIRLRELLPGICFLGGFLFLLLWETKCQYSLGFFIFLFPYCICGYKEIYLRGAASRRP